MIMVTAIAFFWSFMRNPAIPLAVLIPELRRKEKQRRIKAKAEKTSAAIYFDYPGTGILANKDARKSWN
jgi:hypothetical protein